MIHGQIVLLPIPDIRNKKLFFFVNLRVFVSSW